MESYITEPDPIRTPHHYHILVVRIISLRKGDYTECEYQEVETIRMTSESVCYMKLKNSCGKHILSSPSILVIPKAVPLKAPVILHLKDLSFYTTDRPPEELMSLGAGLSQ